MKSAARPINHELRTHAEDPKLSNAQFRLLFLLATDQSRDSENVVLVKQSDLAFWTASNRETVRNRIVAMPRLVTKKTYQVKTDHRQCTYTLHLDKTMADSAVTVSESATSQSMAASAVTVCPEGGTMADRAVTVSETVTDSAVILCTRKNTNQNQSPDELEFEKISNTGMTAESAIVVDYEASEPEPEPVRQFDDEISRMGW